MDPIIARCTEKAQEAVDAGKRSAARGLWFLAIAHYGAAGAALGIASSLTQDGYAKPSLEQDRRLAALFMLVQVGVEQVALVSGNGHRNPPLTRFQKLDLAEAVNAVVDYASQ